MYNNQTLHVETSEFLLTLSTCHTVCLLLFLSESKFIVRVLEHLSFDQSAALTTASENI